MIAEYIQTDAKRPPMQIAYFLQNYKKGKIRRNEFSPVIQKHNLVNIFQVHVHSRCMENNHAEQITPPALNNLSQKSSVSFDRNTDCM